MSRWSAVIGVLGISLLVAACGGGDATPTAPPASTATRPAVALTAAPPTATNIPAAATPSATATAAQTPTRPVPSPTPAPTATRVPVPFATPAGATARRGGILNQATNGGGAPSFLVGITNPALGAANTFAGRLIYQSLFKFDPYNNNTLAGLLADKWEYSSGADQLTVQLRPEAQWADGKPVTSQDVKFTLESYAKPPAGFSAPRFGLLARNVTTIEPANERTIKLGLKDPDVAFVAGLADPDAFVLPANRTLEQSAKDPVGSGPYRLKDFQADVRFNFVKNPNYWGKDAHGGALPYLDGVQNIEIPDPTRQFSAILVGQIDMLNTSFRSALAGKEAQVRRQIPAATFQTYHGGNIGWGVKNAPPMDKPQVRKAMSMLTDRMAFVELVYQGSGSIDAAGVRPASSGSTWALPMKEILSAPGWRHLNKKTGELETDMLKLAQGLSTTYEKDPKDIGAARELLKQVGLDSDKGQFPQLTLTTPSIYQQHAEVLAGILNKSLGVKVQVEVLETALLNQRARQGAFQAIVNTVNPSTADDPSLTLQYFTTGAGFWDPGLAMPELDALYASQRREPDPAKRRALVWEFQRKVLEGVHVIPGVNSLSPGGLFREWVKNAAMPIGSSSNTFDQERVWVER